MRTVQRGAGLVLAASTVIAIATPWVGSAAAVPAASVVNEQNRQGWTAQAYDCTADYLTPDQAFVPGPETPPAGAGSRQLRIGTDPNQTELFRTASYDDTLLADVTDLGYSTYAASNGGVLQQPAYLRLNVDNDGDGQRDASLFFYPANNSTQQLVADDEWQNWDVKNGVINVDGDAGPVTTLDAYAAANPGSTLVNNDDTANGQPVGSGGSIATMVGCSGTNQQDSTFNVDRVVVGTVDDGITTYDFEPQVQTLVVNPTSPRGFVAQAYDCTADYTAPSQAFVTGPATPPVGVGSRQFTIGADSNQTELFRTRQYDGTPLAEVATLQYSTYAASNGGVFQQPPYLRLNLDNDGDGQRDASLFFYPANNSTQQPVADDVWQTWDVAGGVVNVDADGGPTTTLADYAHANPDATLVNNDDTAHGQPVGSGGSIAIIVGCSGANQQDSTFNADRVVVGTTASGVTTFDFEPGTGGGGGGTTGGGTTGSPSASPTASASASPSASASATPSGTPAATSSPAAPSQRMTLALNSPSTITPGIQSKMTATGTPNSQVVLRCYSRTPENANQASPPYFDARTTTLGEDGTIQFVLAPGTNTRCFAKYAGSGDTDPRNSGSVVQNVATALSLSAYRDGVRQYHFQGTNLPRRAGQLVTLYRYATGPNLDQFCVPEGESYEPSNSGPCRAIRTATAFTNSSNVWRIDRKFTGSGQFYFVARTSQTLTNVAGFSNQRLTIIH